MFVFERTRYRVENQFRRGLYDVTGKEIKILK